MNFPSPLTPGSTIGLVTPAGPVVNQQSVREGIRLLEDAGYRIKPTASLDERDHYLAGSDRERAEQFLSVWQDPEIDAILAVRGGYGCMRMLPYLDLDPIRKNPKPLIGFSDLSILLNAVCQECDMVTYHGPMLNTLSRSDKDSLASFFAILDGTAGESYEVPDILVLNDGNASGQLVGGNLASLVHLIGTPYDFPWDGAILFLEDTGEALYRIDRLLTHLYAAGKLKKLSGLILGTISDANGKEEEWCGRVWERVLELVDTGCPVWANFPCGHGERNLTLPVGRVARMEPDTKKLTFS